MRLVFLTSSGHIVPNSSLKSLSFASLSFLMIGSLEAPMNCLFKRFLEKPKSWRDLVRCPLHEQAENKESDVVACTILDLPSPTTQMKSLVKI